MDGHIKNIYMIGICGVAMGTLAAMLKERGFSVSGSDSNVYPPMSTRLKEWGIEINKGFNASSIKDPDLVIIGNAISRGNEEAEHVLNKRIPYLSMSQCLYNFFLKDKEIISVSGTHGKTTTTAILAHIMETAGYDPSFLIGGVSRNYDSNYKLGNGKYFIIEGDEYDSAFFEKIPKFILYRPHHCILTSLEFDHADIYNNIDEIRLWFRRLVNIIPSEGNIVYSDEYPVLTEITAQSFSKCRSFGRRTPDFRYELMGYSGEESNLMISSREFKDLLLSTLLTGDFNYANITSAASLALLLGVEKDAIIEAVKTFTGVKRRQEIIYNSANIKIYEDFAHHPTAIKNVLDEFKKRYWNATVWAIYEPRSATSRRKTLRNDLLNAFNSADRIIIKKPGNLDSIPEADRIDVENIVKILKKKGLNAAHLNSVEEIIDHTVNGIDFSAFNIIIIMSNGGFDGIYEKIVNRIIKMQ